MIKSVRNEAAWRLVVEESFARPVFVFKHSTRCGISAAAAEEVQQFADDIGESAIYQILVVEDRSLSLQIARETGIPHQSPQIILLVDGKPAWNTSHWSISIKQLNQALEQHSQPGQ